MAINPTTNGIPLSDINGAPDIEIVNDGFRKTDELVSTLISTKAPLASPTFTGTVGGITKAMVGLPNVDNTSDSAKPVSTATQNALNLKAPLANPTFTGTVSGITKAMVGLSSVDNTSDLNKPISTATQNALNGKQPAGDYATKDEVTGLIPENIALIGAPSGVVGDPLLREADLLGRKSREYFENVAASFSAACSYAGRVFSLVIADGVVPEKDVFTVVFQAPVGFTAGDGFSLGGKSYGVKMVDGKVGKTGMFASGAAVSAVVDRGAGVVNFKAGGVDVSTATATPADVLSGKTFFAGLDTVRTGTLEKGYSEIFGSYTRTTYMETSKRTNIECEFKPHIVLCWHYVSGGRISFYTCAATLEAIGKPNEQFFLNTNGLQISIIYNTNIVEIYEPAQSPYDDTFYYRILGK